MANRINKIVLKLFRMDNSRNLTELINKRKHNKIKLRFSPIYWPSKTSFLILICVSLVYYILSHININPQISFSDNHYQDFIAIHAGIAAIVFGLIIFIAESSRESKDKVGVLLKVSYLFPIVVLTILGFFNFLWGTVNYLVIIFMVLLGLFVVYSVYSLISILLNNYMYSQEHLELLKDKFKRSISTAVDKRIGHDILMEELKSIELDYLYYIANQNEFYCFYPPKRGNISDINLDKLAEFSKKVEEEAKKQNFHYIFANDRDLEKFSANKGHERYLCRGYKEYINETDALICVNRSLIKDFNIIKELDKLKNEIFTIKDKNESFSKQIRIELKDIRDQFIEAIKNEKRSEIDRCLEVYQILAQALMELLEEYGIEYTFKKAIKERSVSDKDYDEIKWLSEDVQEIFLIGIESNRKNIIRSMIFLPTVIAWNALVLENHFIFQEFMDLLIQAVTESKEREEFESYIIDTSIRYLKTTGELAEQRLKEKAINQEESSLDECITYLLIIFRNLLIKFKNEGDLINFEKIIDALNSLFVPYEEYIYTKTRSKAKNLVENELNSKKLEMLFRLSVMIFNSIETNPENEKFFLKIENSLPKNFKGFTEVFISAYSFKSKDLWDIMMWETVQDNGVVVKNSMEDLERFYVIESLKILKNTPKIDKINLIFDNDEYNMNLASVANSPTILRFMDEIKDNPNEWDFILNQDEINCIDTFKHLLNRSKQIGEEIEKEKIRRGNINHEKVQKFKNDVLNGFKDVSSLRNVFKHFNLYKDKTTETVEDKLRLDLNRIEDKAIFFEKGNFKYPKINGSTIGEKYGHNLAIMEDSTIFKEISNECKKIKKTDFKGILEKMDLSDTIILSAGSGSSFIISSSEFLDKAREKVFKSNLSKFGWFRGYYEFKNHQIPVILSFNRNNGIIIVNKSKLGKLVQYSPLNNIKEKKLINGIFYMDIRAFSDDKELIEEYLETSIDWLEKIDNKEEQKKCLEEKVLIEIYEKFEFKKDKRFEGYFIEFSDNK